MNAVTLRDDFWNDPEKASEVLKKKNRITQQLENWRKQQEAVNDLADLYELAVHDDDRQTISEVEQDLEKLKSAVRRRTP